MRATAPAAGTVRMDSSARCARPPGGSRERSAVYDGTVSEKEAGWYPDPEGENRQRFWDGDRWTEYYTPLAPTHQEIHGAQTATADYPYLVDAHAGAHHGVMVTPGTPSSGWPSPTELGPAAAGGSKETKVFTAGRRRSPAGVVAMVIASLLIVGLVGALGWWLATGGGDPNPGPTGPTVGPTGTGTSTPTPGTTTTGEVDLPGSVDAQVPAAGSWVGNLTLDEDTTLVLDARSADATLDLKIDVLDASGSSVTANDDRGRDLQVLGGISLDPVVLAPLPAGDYQVVVTEVEGAETDFTLSSSVVQEELPFGETTTVQLEEGVPWVGVVDLPAAGRYTFDVRDLGDGDPAIITRGPSGKLLVQDDRDYAGDDYDPLLEETFEAGTQVVIIVEWDSAATTVTISVTETP